MDKDTLIELNSAFYVRSKLSYYPLSHSILPIPDGLVVVVFKNHGDIMQYFKIRGIDTPEDFEILKVQSIYDLMREIAEVGYAGIWNFNNYPIFFGNYISDIDIEIPSFMYTAKRQFIGASGLIGEPTQYYPWNNYSKTDKILRRSIGFVNEIPFDFSEDLFTIVYKDNKRYEYIFSKGIKKVIKYCRFSDASPLQGSYVSDMGAYCIFTEEEYARRYIESKNISGNSIGIQRISINKFSTDLLGMYPYVDIGVNPGNERYIQGYFLRNSNFKLIKTVHGIYEIDKTFSLKKVDDTYNYSNNDTIDKPNTIDPYLRGFLSTIKKPMKYILGTTQSVMMRKEAKIVINNLIKDSEYATSNISEAVFENGADIISQNNISSDSFLVFAFDKITGESFSNNDEMISPYVFKDLLDAILYFYIVYLPIEYDLRFKGFSHCNSQTFTEGTNNKDLEDYIIFENREALYELMEIILTEGYKIEHSELLMSYINRTSISLEIEACGYLGDFGFFKESFIEENLSENEDSEISKKIFNSIQSYKDKLNNKIELSDKYQNKIKLFLGSTYLNLSLESRCILESAIMQLESVKKIINYDYAGISMKLCKTFERELKFRIFVEWKKEVLLNIKKDSLKKYLNETETKKDLNLNTLLKFLLGKGKLELGSMMYIIKRITEQCDHEIFNNLYEYISKLKNKTYILSEEFLYHCTEISTRYRNGGVHEKIISYDICHEAFNSILMNKNSYLKMLLDL